MPVLMPEPKNTLLGKETTYSDQYNPNLLQAIARSLGRDAIGAHDFRGTDIWRLYELSWLDLSGKPQTAVAELWVPAATPSIDCLHTTDLALLFQQVLCFFSQS